MNPRSSAAAAALAAALAVTGCCSHEDRIERPPGHIRANVATDFNPEPDTPRLADGVYVYEDAVVIGSVEVGRHSLIAPHAFIRGDEGQHIRLGDDCNVQDCAGIHALETVELHDGRWHTLPGRLFRASGERVSLELHDSAALLTQRDSFSVWIGDRVSIAHQALVHGPAWVGSDTFVGMQAQIFNAKVGPGCVVLPRALVMGVEVAAGRLVPAGAVVTDQKAADALPLVKGSSFETINRGVVHVNTELAEKYLEQEQHASAGHEHRPLGAHAGH